MTMAAAVGLFSGAGCLDLGLEQAGFNIVASYERDKTRCQTLLRNRPQWNVIEGDIRELSRHRKSLLSHCGDVALVAAGPPCQPFSKSAYWQTSGVIRDKDKSELIFEPLKVAKQVAAQAVLIENVPGLCYKNARPLLDSLLNQLKKSGYKTNWGVLDAADYGVPQHRKRLLILGMSDTRPLLPPPTHGTSCDHVTAGNAIGNLENRPVEEHERVNGKYGELLKKIPPGFNYIHLTERGEGDSVFKYRSKYWSFLLKLSPERPSWTIASSLGKYTGPFHWDNRRLRLSELRRLQTIPDNWMLSGSDRAARMQVGDAMPSLLAQRVGEQILKQLRG
jgi:DNA (cytosine-5)-methyltransferase 1